MLINKSRTGADLLPGVGETKVEVKREAARPQPTGGFVSASPLLVDLDGDGALEVIAGSWDRRVYAWRAGTRVTFWAEINDERRPASGSYGYRVVPDWTGRIRRRVRKWRAKR